MSTIIPNPSTDHIITKDDAGYHVTGLGDEVASIDPSTGEVCRKRPAVSRIDVPRLRPGILAAILADALKDQAGSSNHVEMAGRLLARATAHISDLEAASDKLAAKGMVSK